MFVFHHSAGLCQSSTYVINKTPETFVHVIDMAQPVDVRWAQACADYGQHALKRVQFSRRFISIRFSVWM